MDFVIDQYVMQYIPFNVSDETKAVIKQGAAEVLSLADWMCATADPRLLAQGHSSMVAVETLFTVLFLFTFIHAIKRGNRTFYMWLSVLVMAICAEVYRVTIIDIDNRWYAQSMLTWFGRRIPQFVLFGKYHAIFYSALVIAQRLHFPMWAEGPAVGLLSTLFALPYEILGVKLLWWTWHDNDPNVFDRMYYVPWTELMCFVREWVCAVLAGTLSPLLAFMLFGPSYHLCHEVFKIPTAPIAITYFSILMLLVWFAERNPHELARSAAPSLDFIQMLVVIVYFAFFIFLSFVAEPDMINISGLFQPIGPCDKTHTIRTSIGLELKRPTYLCPTRYNEPYFDFHCLPDKKPPPIRDGLPLEWYNICGTRFTNQNEYVFVLVSTCIVGIVLSLTCLMFSGNAPVVPIKNYKKKVE